MRVLDVAEVHERGRAVRVSMFNGQMEGRVLLGVDNSEVDAAPQKPDGDLRQSNVEGEESNVGVMLEDTKSSQIHQK